MTTAPDHLFPPRPDWGPVPTALHYTKLTSPDPDTPTVWAVVIDTPSARTVTFWDPVSLEDVLRKGLAALGVGATTLTIADIADLRSIGIDPGGA